MKSPAKNLYYKLDLSSAVYGTKPWHGGTTNWRDGLLPAGRYPRKKKLQESNTAIRYLKVILNTLNALTMHSK